MKFQKNQSWALLSILAVSSVCSSFAFADDETVKKGLEEAKASYAQRSPTDSQAVDAVLAKLGPLEGTADDSDLNFDVLILETRALYWKGEHVNSNDEKLAIFASGQAKADEATKINDGYAEGYYYAGISLARWGEAKGVVASLSRKGELIAYMNQTISHSTRDDRPGESIDGNGPDRVFGRMYYKLPAIFGGSHTESVKHLKKATEAAKLQALNIVYYAETLNSGNSSEKALAKQLLDELLAHDPTTFNPDRVQETVQEFELGRKLRDSMN